MQLSVVIVNYNVRYFLEQCLRSVELAIRGIEAEVWVVDNHSADGSVAMLKAQFPWVKLIENQQNSGFSKANNQAILESKGKYVLLLNPDTVVEEDTFRKCLAFMESHPDTGALGVRMIDGSGHFLPESKRGLPTPETAFYKIFGLSALFPSNKRFGKYHLGFLSEHETAEVDVLSGAFMFMRRSALEKSGLLDESFFMYGEDIDLSYRIQLSGFRNIYFPETTIIHYKGESTKKFSVNYVRVFYQAMIIFARKHYGSGKAGLFIAIIRLAVVFRALIALLRRWIIQLRLPLLDALLIFSGLWYIKAYWEEHIKYITSYPKELINIHFPYYIAVWLFAVFMAGGYMRPVSVRRISAGVISGTVGILAIYSLFPEDLRFSRAIILLGAAWTLMSMVLSRLLFHFLRYRNLNLGELPELQTLIVGMPKERQRVLDLCEKARTPNRFIGFVSPDEEEKETPMLLGQLTQLREIIELYHIGEVIFCGADVSSETIIARMNETADLHVQFKIVPENSHFVIGSHSKNQSGELYSDEVRLKLMMEDNLRKKRLADVLFAILILLSFPLLVWFQKSSRKFLYHCFQVLSGEATWVGYSTPKAGKALTQGVFQPWQAYRMDHPGQEIKAHFDYLYARDYHLGMDLQVLLRNLRNLGN